MASVGSASSAGGAFAAQRLPKKSVSSAAEIAFGEDKWKKYFGEIGVAPALPDNIEEILNSSCPFWPDKKVKETHLLVLIPETVDGKRFNLDLLGKIIETPKEGYKTKYSSYDYNVKSEIGSKKEQSHWVLITRDLIPGSRKQSYETHKILAEKHSGKNGVTYRVPKALEVATAILVEHVRSGTKLYSDDRRGTLTCCEERVHSSKGPVAIGGFSSEGLCISYSYAYDYGIASCGSF